MSSRVSPLSPINDKNPSFISINCSDKKGVREEGEGKKEKEKEGEKRERGGEREREERKRRYFEINR